MSAQSSLRRPPLWRIAALLFGMTALRALLVVPVRNLLAVNVAYAESLLPLMLTLLADILQMAVLFVGYAYVIGAVFGSGLRDGVRTALVCFGAAVFGMSVNLLIDLFVHDGWAVFSGLLAVSLTGLLFETLQLAAVFCTALLLARRYHGPLVPVRLFAVQVRPQLAALLAAGIVMAVQIISRVIYDLAYGAPTTASELLEMVTGYASDVLSAFLGYLAMVFLLMQGKENQ